MVLAALIQCHAILAAGAVKLEDVFKSTKENMTQEAGPERLFALALGAIAIVVLLIILANRRKADMIPRPVNNQNRLIREVLKAVPLKDAELQQLKKLAEEQSCSSPLVMLMCPSLIAKALQTKTPEQRKALAPMIKKLTSGGE